MQPENRTAVLTSAFILLAGISGIGLIIPRHESGTLFLAYATAFTGYFWFCKFPPGQSWVLSLGVTLRALLFFGLPTLSDDIYRFLWDGHLLNSGLSPFAELPSSYAQSGNYPNGTNRALYESLNSPDYFTIYPPLNQFIFWVSAKIGGTNWLVSAGVIRFILFTADLGTFFLLRKTLKAQAMNPQLANWYFLNPLVILEGVGNLHFEVLVTSWIILGIYLWYRQRFVISGVAFGLAIATKLLPLIYLPALFWSSRWKKGLVVCLAAVLSAGATFTPMFDTAFIKGISDSLGLYFHTFEFNASIYFLLREVGFWLVGYNAIAFIGPALSILTLVGICVLVPIGVTKGWSLPKLLLFSLSLFLALATTVHPWYTLPLIALGLLSGYYYPIVWSLMIFVTYFGYTKSGFELSPVWIVWEYVVVITSLAIELYKKHNAQTS